VTIPIVIVDPDLRIRRFTGMAKRVLNVVQADVGRSILDIRWKIELKDVEWVLRGVMGTLTPWERDVRSSSGSVRARTPSFDPTPVSVSVSPSHARSWNSTRERSAPTAQARGEGQRSP
jgi:hypothetical protein